MTEYEQFQAAFDPDERCSKPGEDDSLIQRLEVAFDIPVWLSPDDQHLLHELIRDIVYRPCNQIQEGLHWPSGSGSKPQWSKADAVFLGMQSDADAPDTGEPTFDSSVFFIETTARSFGSAKERDRTIKRRKKENREVSRE